ncbi:phosphoethanolamine transferase EptA [Orbaceae bacterium ESL0727]|nr:phosphoethanolamine transferase EptA [Orbaceae bacterium ESL0727]
MKHFFTQITTHAISINLLIILISLYQATCLNLAYYHQVLTRLVLNSLDNILFFVSMPIVIFCLVFIILNLLINKWLIKIVAALLMLIGAPLSYFMLKFSIVIDRGMLQNALETNLAETTALVTPNLIGYVVILGVIPAIIVLMVKVKPYHSSFHFICMRLIAIMATLLIIGLLALLFYKDYAAFMRNNSKIIKYLLPSNYISAAYGQYQFEKYKNQTFLTIGDDAHQRVYNDLYKDDLYKNDLPKKEKSASMTSRKNVLILIVGETARAENFSLNGYHKETNPLLAQRDDVIAFQNVSSCGTYTAYSLPCMFSNMPRKNYDENRAQHQENVLDILKKANVDVTWLDNDNGCKGVCDRINHIDVDKAYQAKASKFCQGDTCYDGVLLQALAEKLRSIQQDNSRNSPNNILIVLHMIGSHGPTYYQRYPEKFKKFQPTCDTNQINNCQSDSLINSYDNTIVYTDFIIDQTIAMLQNGQDEFNGAVIYLSDHGESLGENGVYLHSLPYSIAPKQQTQIPLIMWLSTAWQQQKHIDYDCVKSLAQQNVFSHDNLFHTLLSTFDIETKEYNKSLDILHTCTLNQ